MTESNINYENTDPDVMIILGARLDNNVPGILLLSRLKAAVKYIQTKSGDIPVIVSGGLGLNEEVTEAEAMFRYLVMQGIDESRIWKEEKSTSTRENLAFSIKLMEEKGLDIKNVKVVIVTNGFHQYRSKIIAKKAGLNAKGIAAKTPGLIRRILYCIREAAALISEIILH